MDDSKASLILTKFLPPIKAKQHSRQCDGKLQVSPLSDKICQAGQKYIAKTVENLNDKSSNYSVIWSNQLCC